MTRKLNPSDLMSKPIKEEGQDEEKALSSNPSDLMSTHCLPTAHLNTSIYGNRKEGYSAHQDAKIERGCDIQSRWKEAKSRC